jgi:ATP-dependent exoDNAse (exonuclease V) alpha subunit
LWNAAEAADKRADSRTAREILISLPHELSDEQRHALVRAFVSESLVARGMIADYAIHYPTRMATRAITTPISWSPPGGWVLKVLV